MTANRGIARGKIAVPADRAAAKAPARTTAKTGPRVIYTSPGGKVADKTRERQGTACAATTGGTRMNPGRDSVDALIAKVSGATPLQLVGIERAGVRGRLLKDIAQQMDMPSSRLFTIIGVPKATAEKKAAANDVIAGAGGQAALGMIRLLGIARSIVLQSTADAACDFDSAKWLGRWIETPQPSLGGRKPADFLDTPTGLEIVSKALGAIESGAYQ